METRPRELELGGKVRMKIQHKFFSFFSQTRDKRTLVCAYTVSEVCSVSGVRRQIISFYQNIHALVWETRQEPIASCFWESFSDGLTEGVTSLCQAVAPGPCHGDKLGGKAAAGVAVGSETGQGARGTQAGTCQPFPYAIKLHQKLFNEGRGRRDSDSLPFSLFNLTSIMSLWNPLVMFQSPRVN